MDLVDSVLGAINPCLSPRLSPPYDFEIVIESIAGPPKKVPEGQFFNVCWKRGEKLDGRSPDIYCTQVGALDVAFSSRFVGTMIRLESGRYRRKTLEITLYKVESLLANWTMDLAEFLDKNQETFVLRSGDGFEARVTVTSHPHNKSLSPNSSQMGPDALDADAPPFDMSPISSPTSAGRNLRAPVGGGFNFTSPSRERVAAK